MKHFLFAQGFYNLIIHIRRPLKRIKKEYSNLTWRNAIHTMIFHPEQVRPLNDRRGRGGGARDGGVRRRSSYVSTIANHNKNDRTALVPQDADDDNNNDDVEMQKNNHRKNGNVDDNFDSKRNERNNEPRRCLNNTLLDDINQAVMELQLEETLSHTSAPEGLRKEKEITVQAKQSF